jgi:hypothetical protein
MIEIDLYTTSFNPFLMKTCAKLGENLSKTKGLMPLIA